MLIRNLLVAGLAIVGAGVNDAAAAVIKCNGCSPSAYEAVALQRRTGDHLVYDLINNQVVRFEVHWDGERRAWEVEPAEVLPEITAAVDKLALVHRLTGGSMREQVEVPARTIPTGGMRDATAYDVVNDRVLRTRIQDQIAQNGVPLEGLSDAGRALVESFASTVVAFLGLAEDARLVIVLVFEDGSRVTYEMNFSNQEVSYVSGSARSPEGELLLEENAAEYSGTYRFQSSQSLERFLRQAAQLGIPIVGGGNTVSCTWDGHTLSCKRF